MKLVLFPYRNKTKATHQQRKTSTSHRQRKIAVQRISSEEDPKQLSCSVEGKVKEPKSRSPSSLSPLMSWPVGPHLLQDTDLVVQAQCPLEMPRALLVIVASCVPQTLEPRYSHIKPTFLATKNKQYPTMKSFDCSSVSQLLNSLLLSFSLCRQTSKAYHLCKWHQENTTRFSMNQRDNLFHIFESNNMRHSTPKLIFQMNGTKSQLPLPPS